MTGDGINHQNESILFPPTVEHGRPPVVPLAELIDDMQKKIQLVIEKGATPQTVSASTALTMQMRKVIAFAMKRAVINERERCRQALEKNGMTESVHAIMGNPDG